MYYPIALCSNEICVEDEEEGERERWVKEKERERACVTVYTAYMLLLVGQWPARLVYSCENIPSMGHPGILAHGVPRGG